MEINKEITPINSDENGRDEKGRFLVGNIGKPKGASNKTTKELQKFITNFLNEKSFEIPLIWDCLDEKEKATLYIHLAKLVLPKQIKENDLKDEIRPVIINLGTGIKPNEDDRN